MHIKMKIATTPTIITITRTFVFLFLLFSHNSDLNDFLKTLSSNNGLIFIVKIKIKC